VKTNANFNLPLRVLAAIVSIFTSALSHHYNVGDGNRAQGRGAFYGVSAGRQHNVKTRHPL
jgi:hypothetical protein